MTNMIYPGTAWQSIAQQDSAPVCGDLFFSPACLLWMSLPVGSCLLGKSSRISAQPPPTVLEHLSVAHPWQRCSKQGDLCLQLFMLFLVHAYGARLWNDKTKWPHQHVYQIPALTESLLYMDAPWRLQWPCLVPWLIAQAIVSVAWLRNAVRRKSLLAVLAPCGFICVHISRESCSLPLLRCCMVCTLDCQSTTYCS